MSTTPSRWRAGINLNLSYTGSQTDQTFLPPTFAPETWFLAKMDGALVGFSLCDAVVPEDENIAWLLSLGVKREARRQGIALGLLHYTFNEFYRRGKTGVIVGVDTQSLTNALRLYERAGMVPYQRFDEPEKELRPGRRMDTH